MVVDGFCVWVFIALCFGDGGKEGEEEKLKGVIYRG